MNMERSLGFLFFLILLLFPHQEMMVDGSGGMEQVHPNRLCHTQSHKFKGACASDGNCGNVCKSEGFPSGHCRGFRRRCFCEKNC